jgi:hypothetical protein
MKTNEKTVTAESVHNLDTKGIVQHIAPQDKTQTEEIIIVHEAKIIIPQPYGVFALCKIVEHFQIN